VNNALLADGDTISACDSDRSSTCATASIFEYVWDTAVVGLKPVTYLGCAAHTPGEDWRTVDQGVGGAYVVFRNLPTTNAITRPFGAIPTPTRDDDGDYEYNEDDYGGSNWSSGKIAGAALGGVLAFLILGLAFPLCVWRAVRQSRHRTREGEIEERYQRRFIRNAPSTSRTVVKESVEVEDPAPPSYQDAVGRTADVR